jgi:hypothetical protein
VNKVVLTGRLTRDPEMRSLASGKSVTQFAVATNAYAGGKEKAEYHNVVTWDYSPLGRIRRGDRSPDLTSDCLQHPRYAGSVAHLIVLGYCCSNAVDLRLAEFSRRSREQGGDLASRLVCIRDL